MQILNLLLHRRFHGIGSAISSSFKCPIMMDTWAFVQTTCTRDRHYQPRFSYGIKLLQNSSTTRCHDIIHPAWWKQLMNFFVLETLAILSHTNDYRVEHSSPLPAGSRTGQDETVPGTRLLLLLNNSTLIRSFAIIPMFKAPHGILTRTYRWQLADMILNEQSILT